LRKHYAELTCWLFVVTSPAPDDSLSFDVRRAAPGLTIRNAGPDAGPAVAKRIRASADCRGRPGRLRRPRPAQERPLPLARRLLRTGPHGLGQTP
jgi:hypothetical protein